MAIFCESWLDLTITRIPATNLQCTLVCAYFTFCVNMNSEQNDKETKNKKIKFKIAQCITWNSCFSASVFFFAFQQFDCNKLKLLKFASFGLFTDIGKKMLRYFYWNFMNIVIHFTWERQRKQMKQTEIKKSCNASTLWIIIDLIKNIVWSAFSWL